MPRGLLAVLALLRNPAVSRLPRAAVLLALAYLVLPVDLVPEVVFPIVGWLDDAVLVWASVRWLLRQKPDATDPALPGPGQPPSS